MDRETFTMETEKTNSLNYSQSRANLQKHYCQVPGVCPGCGGNSLCIETLAKGSWLGTFVSFVIGVVVGCLVSAAMSGQF